MNRNVTIAVVVVTVLVGFGAWYFLHPGPAFAEAPESIVVGEKPYEADALVYIAQDRGFFAGNGLNVTTRTYTSVTKTLDGLLNDEVDVGLASEYAIAGKLFNTEKEIPDFHGDISTKGLLEIKPESVNIR